MSKKHKYIAKVKLGSNRTRYFYTKAEYDAYNRAKNTPFASEDTVYTRGASSMGFALGRLRSRYQAADAKRRSIFSVIQNVMSTARKYANQAVSAVKPYVQKYAKQATSVAKKYANQAASAVESYTRPKQAPTGQSSQSQTSTTDMRSRERNDSGAHAVVKKREMPVSNNTDQNSMRNRSGGNRRKQESYNGEYSSGSFESSNTESKPRFNRDGPKSVIRKVGDIKPKTLNSNNFDLNKKKVGNNPEFEDTMKRFASGLEYVKSRAVRYRYGTGSKAFDKKRNENQNLEGLRYHKNNPLFRKSYTDKKNAEATRVAKKYLVDYDADKFRKEKKEFKKSGNADLVKAREAQAKGEKKKKKYKG